MKQLSEEKRLRLNELEKLTYEVEIGNTHKVRKMKGNLLNSAFLLGELSDSRRMMLVRQVENERRPVRVENKAFEKTRTELFRIIAEHSGQPLERVAADGDRDFWMTAEEAKAYGMVDEILYKKSK